jgi:hypothetical protein
MKRIHEMTAPQRAAYNKSKKAYTQVGSALFFNLLFCFYSLSFTNRNIAAFLLTESRAIFKLEPLRNLRHI